MTDMGANRTFPGVSDFRFPHSKLTFKLRHYQNGLLAGPRRPFH
jgi:hypothetical protein